MSIVQGSSLPKEYHLMKLQTEVTKRKGNDQFQVSGKLAQSRLLKGWIDARKLKVYFLDPLSSSD